MRLALIVLLLATLLPMQALAHAQLRAADPGPGVVVAAPRDAVTLTFNEPVEPLVLRWIGPDSAMTELPGEASGNGITVVPPEGLTEGTHFLSWRVVSADGHPVGGTHSFHIGAPPAAGEPATGAARAAALGGAAATGLLAAQGLDLLCLPPAGLLSPAPWLAVRARAAREHGASGGACARLRGASASAAARAEGGAPSPRAHCLGARGRELRGLRPCRDGRAASARPGGARRTRGGAPLLDRGALAAPPDRFRARGGRGARPVLDARRAACRDACPERGHLDLLAGGQPRGASRIGLGPDRDGETRARGRARRARRQEPARPDACARRRRAHGGTAPCARHPGRDRPRPRDPRARLRLPSRPAATGADRGRPSRFTPMSTASGRWPTSA